MRFVNSLVNVIVTLVLLAGCTMAVDPNFHSQSSAHQVETDAGQWQTWVLTSTADVMPAPPPDRAATLAEIAQLKTMAAQRDDAAAAQAAYWNAGSPSYRWISMAIAENAAA